MSGNKYLLDTNAVISIINGNKELLHLTNHASYVALSIVSVIEFLSFPDISEKDKHLLSDFIKDVEVIDLAITNYALLAIITHLRSSYKIKLPGAIIVATAIHKGAALLTNDKGFQKIPSLNVLTC